MRAGGIACALIVLCGCSSSVPPPPGVPVPFTIVSTSGLLAGGMGVIADSSVQGLSGLLQGVSDRNQAICQERSPSCWSSAGFPAGSAAFGVEVYQGCNPANLAGAYLSGSSLAFDVRVEERACSGDMLAEPTFELVAISMADLPPALMRVHVYYEGLESSKSTLLDLRAPVPDAPPVATRVVEVERARLLAAGVGPPSGYIIELAARRFASGPNACAPPTAADSQLGYVIVFDGVDGEFDYSAGTVVHCPAS